MRALSTGLSFPPAPFCCGLIRGFCAHTRSFQFGAECLGQHEGSHQIIDLGDGNGPSAFLVSSTLHPA